MSSTAAAPILPSDELPAAAEAEINRAWQAMSKSPDEATLQDVAASLYAMCKVNATAYPETNSALRQAIDDELSDMAAHACIGAADKEKICAKARRQGVSVKTKAQPVANGHSVVPERIKPAAPVSEIFPPTEGWRPPSFINVAAWQHTQPTVREWAIPDRAPLKNVTLFSGEGGVGKSLIALQCSTAVAAHCDWLGKVPEQGPALVVCCEDDEAELHRRMARVAQHYNMNFADLAKHVHIISLAGKDAMMAVPSKSGLMQPTQLLKWVHEAARDIRPRVTVLDNSADVFGGNENDRAQVRQFITMLREVAIDANTGLILTSHPSNRGVDTGSGLSGSTAWHASVRSRLYLKRAVTDRDEEPDPDLRVLEVMKSNYGPIGKSITLRWKDGLFLPAHGTSPLERTAAEHRHDEMFLTLLRQFDGQGRNVSDKPSAPTYAPAMFAKEQLAKGVRKPELASAMRRLFAANRIHVQQYGRPSRPASKLAIGQEIVSDE